MWYIILPGASTSSQFTHPESIALLNGEHIYKMPVIELGLTRTIKLYINSTEGKNGTIIQCVNPGTAEVISEMTLIG